MKNIEIINFKSLPDWAQDQIARELVDDFDSGYDPREFYNMNIDLIEYDPENSQDKEILQEWLKEKIANEGDPEIKDLEHYHNNIEELISFPILIISGSCSEGRHRLLISLLHHHKIRAYVC